MTIDYALKSLSRKLTSWTTDRQWHVEQHSPDGRTSVPVHWLRSSCGTSEHREGGTTCDSSPVQAKFTKLYRILSKIGSLYVMTCSEQLKHMAKQGDYKVNITIFSRLYWLSLHVNFNHWYICLKLKDQNPTN